MTSSDQEILDAVTARLRGLVVTIERRATIPDGFVVTPPSSYVAMRPEWYCTILSARFRAWQWAQSSGGVVLDRTGL